jgi:hypothetical protein
LDVTAVLQFDVNGAIQQLSGSDLDCIGAPKIVFYENGINFYKNMVTVIVSTLMIIIINLIIYLVLRILPINFTRKLSQKLKIRWPITLSDLI